tara:strand:- start:1493 stop:2272 length:780 start_codon:yes stop_codon:yes gene_type:complete
MLGGTKMLGEPVVIGLSDIEYSTTHPYARNERGEWIQHPIIHIKSGGQTYQLLGKEVMWSYFDALFSDDPLPRSPVNEDIFSPDVDSPSLYSLLKEFTKEVREDGIEYIVVYHEEGVVNYVQSFDQSLLSDIDVMVENLKYVTRKPAIKKPFVYRAKNVTLRPSLMVPINGCSLEMIDLGNKWYYRLTGVGRLGILISLIKPYTTTKKDSEATYATIRRLVRIALNTNIVGMVGSHIKTTDSMRTNELDSILHKRGLSI